MARFGSGIHSRFFFFASNGAWWDVRVLQERAEHGSLDDVCLIKLPNAFAKLSLMRTEVVIEVR